MLLSFFPPLLVDLAFDTKVTSGLLVELSALQRVFSSVIEVLTQF